jgi:transposase-like protein
MGATLPPPDTKRWTIRRKAAVLAAVRAGEITREEVCSRYEISEAEFHSWRRTFELYGLAGLRVTRLRTYRSRPS